MIIMSVELVGQSHSLCKTLW